MTAIIRLLRVLAGMVPELTYFPSHIAMPVKMSRGKITPSSNAAQKRQARKRRNIAKRLPLKRR